ncbi:MAG: PIN domain-containing protein [Azoarcus sp.]|jgi:predicted nucleic acid-binding protein|nr:PIN domain-containing protein [Azoarcus sp.]
MRAAESGKISDSSAPVHTVTVERPRTFADSNVPLYIVSDDKKKAAMAEAIVRAHAFVSVQVLNEIANVLHLKRKFPWGKIEPFLRLIRSLCPVEPLTVESHEIARRIADRYKLQFYDSLIAASALRAGCDTLYSEDMQHGLLLEGQLRIVDPFAP